MAPHDEAAKPLVNQAKQNLYQKAQELKQKHGMLMFDRNAKSELTRALSQLQNAQGKTFAPNSSYLMGDWSLVCSTVSSNNVKFPSLPRFMANPIEKIRSNTRKHVSVQQRISCNVAGVPDVFDTVVEIKSPIRNLPLLLNPFKVEKTKLILRQKANVRKNRTTEFKLFSKNLAWKIVGSSRFLGGKEGRRLAGVPIPSFVPLVEGNFETTFVDETLRVCRGRIGALEQMQVFVRTPKSTTSHVVAKTQAQARKAPSDDENDSSSKTQTAVVKDEALEDIETLTAPTQPSVSRQPSPSIASPQEAVPTLQNDSEDQSHPVPTSLEVQDSLDVVAIEEGDVQIQVEDLANKNLPKPFLEGTQEVEDHEVVVDGSSTNSSGAVLNTEQQRSEQELPPVKLNKKTAQKKASQQPYFAFFERVTNPFTKGKSPMQKKRVFDKDIQELEDEIAEALRLADEALVKERDGDKDNQNPSP